jgi:hypothetical protein
VNTQYPCKGDHLHTACHSAQPRDIMLPVPQKSPQVPPRNLLCKRNQFLVIFQHADSFCLVLSTALDETMQSVLCVLGLFIWGQPHVDVSGCSQVACIAVQSVAHCLSQWLSVSADCLFLSSLCVPQSVACLNIGLSGDDGLTDSGRVGSYTNS